MNIYVSLTSIFQNQNVLLKTLVSIKQQIIKPSRLFLYLSEEPYLLDLGFKDRIITDSALNSFIQENSDLIELRWTENTGPYRKLLPLLKEKWSEDCVIITIDDDTEYVDTLIQDLVNDYMLHKCVINYRGFTPKISKIEEMTYENQRLIFIEKYIYNFPTGKGGILYHPSFFKGTGDLIFNKEMYMTLCRTTDDVWFFMIRICNKVECFLRNIAHVTMDNTTQFALFANFNSRNKTNTKYLKDTILALKEKGYLA